MRARIGKRFEHFGPHPLGQAAAEREGVLDFRALADEHEDSILLGGIGDVMTRETHRSTRCGKTLVCLCGL
jgi:hypothetical protein